MLDMEGVIVRGESGLCYWPHKMLCACNVASVMQRCTNPQEKVAQCAKD